MLGRDEGPQGGFLMDHVVMVQDHLGQGLTVVGREVPPFLKTLPSQEDKLHSPNHVLVLALGIEISCIQLAPTKHGRRAMLIDDVTFLL